MAKKTPINEKEELLKALSDDAPVNEDEREGQKGVDEDGTEEAEETDEKKTAEPVKEKSVSKKNGKKASKGSKNGDGTVVPPPSATIKKPADDGGDKRKKRRLAIIITVAGVALIGAAVAGYLLIGKDSGTTETNTNAGLGLTNQDTLVPRRIDGVMDKPENQNKFPIALMVENSTASRPQSGLDKANIVYEALAEGGITRFLALYTLSGSVKEIGPVRSARPYYVDWARGYNALYVHIGGSPKALSRIASTSIRDFNQFFNSQYFWRDKTRDVASEHTLYTSDYLLELAKLDKNYPTTGDFEPWKYKDDAASSTRPASQHVTVNFSTFSYKVDYEYDPVMNVYARSVAEKPHIMRDDTQLKPKNVVVLTVARRLEEPVKDNHGRLEMDTIGEGAARYFMDGKETTGTWKKGSSQEPLQLLDANAAAVLLNAGQTWVEIVPPDQQVTVQ